LEEYYQFESFHSPPLTDADIDAKPSVLLLGQYSVGKTTFVKYQLIFFIYIYIFLIFHYYLIIITIIIIKKNTYFYCFYLINKIKIFNDTFFLLL